MTMYQQPWFVYLLLCADGSYYAGITTDLERRVREHNESSRGARYTRARRPLSLAYSESCASRSEACRREQQLRRLPHASKRALCKGA